MGGCGAFPGGGHLDRVFEMSEVAMISLSQHFKERWVELVDAPLPSGADLERWINTSVRLQRHRDVRTRQGVLLYRALAMYWNPEIDVVVKIDARSRTAVTVASPKLLEAKNGKNQR